MQMCPDCNKVYDESEYSRCPYCNNDDSDQYYIVYDDDVGEALSLSESEFEEFKKNHPDYQ